MTDLRDVTPTVAAHALHEFGYDGGHKGGRFVTRLIAAIVAADEPNRALLAMAYGGYVRAVRALQDSSTGLSEVRCIARKGGR